MSDEMPLQMFSRDKFRFLNRFLNTIFTQGKHPGVNRLLNDSRREGFGNGDERDLFGATSGAFRYAVNALANLCEPCSYLFTHLPPMLASRIHIVTKSNTGGFV